MLVTHFKITLGGRGATALEARVENLTPPTNIEYVDLTPPLSSLTVLGSGSCSSVTDKGLFSDLI